MAVLMAGGDSAPGGLVLCGRRDECAVLDGLLQDARSGQSGVLLLRGDAGIGKTALLAHAIRSASDMRVLRAVEVEAEMELPFAALHQLCAPLLDRLDGLPGPQRDALATTFGLSAGAVPDRLFVGLAVLGMLSEAAEVRPLLCVIDDAQWLDRASAQALAFVARRMLAESVVMLFAAREPSDLLAGLPELVLKPLADADARALLASVIPGRLDERIADELLAETRGNPLALLELPRGLSPAQLAGGFGLPEALSLSLEGRIEESFVTRLEALPDDTQRLLLVAAAEATGDPALLWRAAGRLGITRPALKPAESAGLIEVGARFRFRHPLVRSAVYGTASPSERRHVHEALAESTDAQVDPDRRAWHRARAVSGPDEEVAAELERSAARAQSRGGMSAAAAFLERAAALTQDPLRRAKRSLAAAQTKYEAGSLEDAFALLAMVEAGAVDEDLRARMRLVYAEITFASRRNSGATELLLKAARDLEVVDPMLARATYLEAMNAAYFAGRLARGAGIGEVSRAALAAPPPPDPPRPGDLLLHALAIRSTEGFAAGAPLLKKALGTFLSDMSLQPGEARRLVMASWAAGDLWDDETWALLSVRHVELVREAGALTAIPIVLDPRTAFQAMSGELSAAASLVVEMQAAAEATGIPPHPYGALSLAALRGQDTELSELESTLRDAVSRGEGAVLAYAPFARATLYNGLAQYDAALDAARQAGQRADDLGAQTWAVPELIEAAVRCGKPEVAGPALERLVETTGASGTDWALGTEARSRALLSDDEIAESLYREAIERLQRTRMRVDLARAHLLYGEWLRREDRRIDAREPLRAAHEMFMAMGAAAFAERARLEMLATGEKVRKPTVESRDELTAQERQIARLARDGLSNAEIASRMFISRHTVAYHLRKVFSKLGISSRNQLDRVLPGSASAGQVA
jgi:DNA-binding CsgD family transcriptional regulator